MTVFGPLIDFGSTFTRITAVELRVSEVVTTVFTDVSEGSYQALITCTTPITGQRRVKLSYPFANLSTVTNIDLRYFLSIQLALRRSLGRAFGGEAL